MLFFENDYAAAAHPAVLQALGALGLNKYDGYGCDEICAEARALILSACGLQGSSAEVFFLSGGTQTNLTVLDSLLHPTQGVIAAHSGHISVHEAGAIESRGHKVLTIPGHDGKLSAAAVEAFLENFQRDANAPHMVQPGAIYISQPTEYGTLYSKAELTALHELALKYELPIYVDGARLAYALVSPDNDVSLADLAKLCEVFYIGGTKCGTLYGEAVVFTQKAPRFFFTLVKQRGALAAKGFVLGAQFKALFADGLYFRIGAPAVVWAREIGEALAAGGRRLLYPVQTNQVFAALSREDGARLSQHAVFSYWEPLDAEHDLWRIALSWATQESEVQALKELLHAAA